MFVATQLDQRRGWGSCLTEQFVQLDLDSRFAARELQTRLVAKELGSHRWAIEVDRAGFDRCQSDTPFDAPDYSVRLTRRGLAERLVLDSGRRCSTSPVDALPTRLKPGHVPIAARRFAVALLSRSVVPTMRALAVPRQCCRTEGLWPKPRRGCGQAFSFVLSP